MTGAELEAYYEAADVFVWPRTTKGSACRGRGHGPRRPVVAYGVTAVPETVGDGGLVLPDKSPVSFAAAVGRVLGDATLRQVLTASREVPR